MQSRGYRHSQRTPRRASSRRKMRAIAGRLEVCTSILRSPKAVSHTTIGRIPAGQGSDIFTFARPLYPRGRPQITRSTLVKELAKSRTAAASPLRAVPFPHVWILHMPTSHLTCIAQKNGDPLWWRASLYLHFVFRESRHKQTLHRGR